MRNSCYLSATSDHTRFLRIWLRSNRTSPPFGSSETAGICRSPWRRQPPQKNVGSVPCPNSLQFVWLPLGSHPLLAHAPGDSLSCTGGDIGVQSVPQAFTQP